VYYCQGRVMTQAVCVLWSGSCYDSGGYSSEEHASELQSPVPISYAVFCLKKKNVMLEEGTVGVGK
jgi:hypothetical protein